MIQAKEGYPPANQKLIISGVELEDDKTMGDIDFSKESSIRLSIKIPPSEVAQSDQSTTTVTTQRDASLVSTSTSASAEPQESQVSHGTPETRETSVASVDYSDLDKKMDSLGLGEFKTKMHDVGYLLDTDDNDLGGELSEIIPDIGYAYIMKLKIAIMDSPLREADRSSGRVVRSPTSVVRPTATSVVQQDAQVVQYCKTCASLNKNSGKFVGERCPGNHDSRMYTTSLPAATLAEDTSTTRLSSNLSYIDSPPSGQLTSTLPPVSADIPQESKRDSVTNTSRGGQAESEGLSDILTDAQKGTRGIIGKLDLIAENILDL